MRGYRRFASALALLAIAIQSFFIQTHVHPHFDWDGLPRLAHGLTIERRAVSDPGQLPAKSDIHCPICQQRAASGHSAILDAATLALPELAILIAYVAVALSVSFSVASHNWYGRAPPSL